MTGGYYKQGQNISIFGISYPCYNVIMSVAYHQAYPILKCYHLQLKHFMQVFLQLTLFIVDNTFSNMATVCCSIMKFVVFLYLHPWCFRENLRSLSFLQFNFVCDSRVLLEYLSLKYLFIGTAARGSLDYTSRSLESFS